MTIDSEKWSTCKICGKTIQEISKDYKEKGKYKTDYFRRHLIECHEGMTPEEYFDKKRVCPCGSCGKPLQIKRTPGKDFQWRELACGRNKGVQKWSEEAKVSRMGDKNPMFGRTPWNKDKNKKNSEYGRMMIEHRIGTKASEETKKKQSESAKKRKVHGHTGKKHSEESKQKMREATLKRIKYGCFPQTDTRPCREMKHILDSLHIRYEEEKILGHWAFDFYLVDYDVYVEVDGDYFHSNPALYPDGPKTKTQKINHYRDHKKNKFCKNNNIKLIRFWESQILGDKECVLQKLNQLKK
jgi:very-short-patch-repair endonuclease